jgi:hypothetical protein
VITSSLLSFLDFVLGGMLSGLPAAPEWLQGVGAEGAGFLQSALNGVAKWGFIVPFETLAVVFPIAIGAFVLSIVIKVLRIVASYVTLGGGM